ncbi:radial spoke head 14 homolog [Cylas formicarius]|uniref:radial spoke head 14 homolog n=1 Tax=Cylas formicarius TaxID=197179 RepID=UPI0029585829|nr:radial spoke head 14 homolog [Cylas formicarius]XP_060531808.1 radial spoke head 14 homolog [Cylas formicarius]
MQPCHHYSYLQGDFENVNPRILNRSAQKAYKNIDRHSDERVLEPVFNRLTSAQPNIPVAKVDVTRRPQGYGKWALPKLKRELHDKNPQIVVAAITSICDLVHDPERAYEAIKIKVIDRLVDLIRHEDGAIRERATNTLTGLAGLAAGREAIVGNKLLLANLADIVDDENLGVRIHVAACLEMVARFWMTADVLVDAGFIQILLGTIVNERPEVVDKQLDTLESLIYGKGKEIVIQEGGFQTLIKFLEHEENSIAAKTCKLIALMCYTEEGRKLSKELDLLPILNRLLHYTESEVHTAAAEAIMVCTITSEEKIRASTIKSMMKRLVQLSRTKLNATTQVFAIKALTSICEHPEMRREINEKYKAQIEDIQLGDFPNADKFKEDLIKIVDWVPYE